MKGKVALYRFMLCFVVGYLYLGLGTVYANEPAFELKAHLALREVAHRLLQEQGDSTSSIPPVDYREGKGFYLTYGASLDYSRLKLIVDEIFEKRGLPLTYQLGLFACDNDLLVLGYNAIAGEVGVPPACTGREEKESCYNIAVQFPVEQQNETSPLWLMIIPILFMLGGAFWWWNTNSPKPIPMAPLQQKELTADPIYQLGILRFDPENQLLFGGGEDQRLTFRESKLLDLFCQHRNHLLSREEILEFVWGDEGVMVGRSVDVFVSRLRKKLKREANIKITSVHGVGYRLELGETLEQRAKPSNGFRYSLNEN